MLRKTPGVTAIALLSLALGIGINTVIFGALKSFLFVLPPIHKPSQIAIVWAHHLQTGVERSPVSLMEFQMVRDTSAAFGDVEACNDVQFHLSGEGASAQVSGMRVSGGFFRLLGAEPLLGRVIQASDESPGANPVVLISHTLWQRFWNGDRGILGRTLRLDKRSFAIVGVMPREFWFQYPGVDVWIALPPAPAEAHAARRNLRMVARLKEGTSIQEARAEMKTLAAQLEREAPGTNSGWGLNPILITEEQTKRAGFGIAFLFLPVLFVLLIACGNVTNLLLARASQRRQEMAVRAALGAGRVRVIRQLLTESSLISVAAGAAGILLAYGGMRLFRTIVLADVPHLAEKVQMDFGVFLFALALCLLTPLLFGLAPAMETARMDLGEALKSGGREGGPSRRHRRDREVLVFAEVVLVAVLLIPTGLLLRAMVRLGQVDFGFDAGHVLTMPVAVVSDDSPDARPTPALLQALADRVGTTPGVKAVAVSDRLPGAFGMQPAGDAVVIESTEGQPARAGHSARTAGVSHGYFEAMGLRLLRGRDLAEASRADGPPGIAVVSNSAAKRFWPGEDPIGKRFRFLGPANEAEWFTVVGVVGDVVPSVPGGPTVDEAKIPAQVYVPLGFPHERSLYLLVRTRPSPQSLLPALRDAVRSVDVQLPVDKLATVRQTFEQSLSESNTVVGMLGSVSTLALALAAVGVFGALSYLVAQRMREIGVRMALGAQHGQILKMVMWQGIKPVLVGLLVGWGGGYALALMLAREIAQFGLAPGDAGTFLGSGLVIVSVGLLACYVPARRASRLDPMVILRCE